MRYAVARGEGEKTAFSWTTNSAPTGIISMLAFPDTFGSRNHVISKRRQQQLVASLYYWSDVSTQFLLTRLPKWSCCNQIGSAHTADYVNVDLFPLEGLSLEKGVMRTSIPRAFSCPRSSPVGGPRRVLHSRDSWSCPPCDASILCIDHLSPDSHELSAPSAPPVSRFCGCIGSV